MPLLALLVTMKLSQAGSITTLFFEVMISTVCPLSSSTFIGASFLFTLQPTIVSPRSLWIAYAKSIGVAPIFSPKICPFGEKTNTLSGSKSVFIDSTNSEESFDSLYKSNKLVSHFVALNSVPLLS